MTMLPDDGGMPTRWLEGCMLLLALVMLLSADSGEELAHVVALRRAVEAAVDGSVVEVPPLRHVLEAPPHWALGAAQRWALASLLHRKPARGALRLERGVTLRAAAPGAAIEACAGCEFAAVSVAQGATVRLEGLRLAAARRGAARASLAAVWNEGRAVLSRCAVVGMIATVAVVDEYDAGRRRLMRRWQNASTVVLDTAVSGSRAEGVVVDGGQLLMRNSAVSGCADCGVCVLSGGSAALHSTSIASNGGDGLLVADASSVCRVESVTITRNGGAGVYSGSNAVTGGRVIVGGKCSVAGNVEGQWVSSKTGGSISWRDPKDAKPASSGY